MILNFLEIRNENYLINRLKIAPLNRNFSVNL